MFIYIYTIFLNSKHSDRVLKTLHKGITALYCSLAVYTRYCYYCCVSMYIYKLLQQHQKCAALAQLKINHYNRKFNTVSCTMLAQPRRVAVTHGGVSLCPLQLCLHLLHLHRQGIVVTLALLHRLCQLEFDILQSHLLRS